MESIPKSVSPVCPRKDFCRLTGTVTERWDYRSIDKCNGVEKEIDVFEDDGPFFKDYKAVFNVTLELDQNEGDGSSSMNIFFYDRWAADASQKLLKGDTLTISGSHALLVNNHLPINSSGEHQCCIAIRESEQPCDLSSIIHFELIINDMESSRRKIISTEHGGRYGSSSSISPKRKSPSKNSNFSGEGASAGFTSSVRVDKPSAHKVIPSIHPHEVTALKRSFEISSNCSSLGGMQSSSSHTRLLPRESTSPLILRRKVPFLPVPPANDGHIYIPFENLPAHASSIVHIFGVIVSFQVSPKACQGSNRYSCTYTLIDMTKPNPHNPVGLNVFADNIEDFPKCIRAGDIIRCTKVMVEIRNGYSKLIGNPRNKSSYITFSRKVNFLTGFSESIDESCRTEGLRLDCPWGLFSLEWVVHSSDKNKRRENETITMQKVKQLHSWAEGLFMGCTLGEKNKTDKSLHEVYQNTTFTVENEGFSRAPKIDRCDVICMVAATASEITGKPSGVMQNLPNEVTSVLLWDGSTAGYLAPSAAVSQSDYFDINTSLRAATVFARRIDDSDCQRLSDFKEEVERQGCIPGYLYGSPLIVTSAPSDQLTAGRLKDLKPGMWLRFRNLHVDKQAVERTFLPFSSALSSTASSPLKANTSDDAHKIAIKLNSWIVGSVHSDTHISLMLPYYKDVGYRANNYSSMGTQNGHVKGDPKLKISANQKVITQTNSSTNDSVEVAPKRIRKMYNAAGFAYSNLALGLSRPPPNKFHLVARILSYKPTDISRFTCRRPSTSGDEDGRPIFRFSVRIADDTMETDALLFDQNAEVFLGVTAAEFERDLAAQEKVQKRLNELSGVQMDCTSAENEVHIEGEDQQQQQQQEQQKQQLLQQQQITLDFTISSYYSSVILPTTGERSLKIAISDTCIM